MVIAAKG
jgi:hypothetical protein